MLRRIAPPTADAPGTAARYVGKCTADAPATTQRHYRGGVGKCQLRHPEPLRTPINERHSEPLYQKNGVFGFSRFHPFGVCLPLESWPRLHSTVYTLYHFCCIKTSSCASLFSLDSQLSCTHTSSGRIVHVAPEPRGATQIITIMRTLDWSQNCIDGKETRTSTDCIPP